jgi:2,3-diaminopropionate biosynthesis protein SbnB
VGALVENGSDILILKGHEVLSLLRGREHELLDTVRRTYAAHAEGKSSLPQSLFLRFPGDNRNRVIALPAYLGDGFDVAGMKWVSSFPGNLEKGLERASAVVVLNSPETGRPEAIIEGSIISARRTAASAALAAQVLRGDRGLSPAGLVGCGRINFEILRFLLAVDPDLERLLLFDLDVERAEQFADRCRALSPGLRVEVAPDLRAVLAGCPLISFATTAVEPHVSNLADCAPGTTILNVSLRDFAPEAILAADNVVDDVDHVCRAQTSVHLAEQLAGNRDFIRCTLAEVCAGTAPAKKEPSAVTIFSPFGLGVLDIAVGKLLCRLARASESGTLLSSFLPEPWAEAG